MVAVPLPQVAAPPIGAGDLAPAQRGAAVALPAAIWVSLDRRLTDLHARVEPAFTTGTGCG